MLQRRDMNNQSDRKLPGRVQDKTPGVVPARQTVTVWCVFSFAILHFHSPISRDARLSLDMYICVSSSVCC